MPHKEVLFVVVGVNKPAGDAVGVIAAHLTAEGIEYVYSVDLNLYLLILGVKNVDVRLPKDDEAVAVTGVGEVLGHMQVGVYPGLEHIGPSQLLKLIGMGVAAERTGDEGIQAGVCGLAGPMQSMAARRQVIMTTQSVTLLDQFAPDHIIVVEREENVDNGFEGAAPAELTFRRVSDRRDLDTWLDDYTIGELWEMNVIGGRP